MKAKISQAKLDANRRNATKSTGPRTVEGKKAVRMNAVSHGLLTKDILIDCPEMREDIEEFSCLFEGLRRYFLPKGQVEDLLVERIALSYWRLRRAVRFETIHLTGMLLHANERGMRDAAMNAGESDYIVSIRQEIEVLRTKAQRMAAFDDAISKGASLNDLAGNYDNELMFHCGLLMVGKTDDMEQAVSSETQEIQDPNEMAHRIVEESGLHGDDLRAMIHTRSTQLIELINLKVQKLEQLLEVRRLIMTSNAGEGMVPEENVLERLSRYETTIERQLYRAMLELARLQDRRMGRRVL